MAGTVRELRAVFSATMGGMRKTIRQVQNDIQGIGTSTETAVVRSNKSFDKLSAKVKKVEKELDDLDKQEVFVETRENVDETSDSLEKLNSNIKKSRDAFKQLDASTKVKDDKGRFYSLSFNRLEESVKNLQVEFKETGKVGQESFMSFGREVSKARAALSQLGDADGVEQLVAAIDDAESHMRLFGHNTGLPEFRSEVGSTESAMDKLRGTVMDVTVVGKALRMSLVGLAPAAVPALASATSGAMGLVSALGAAAGGATAFGVVAIPTLTKVFEGYKAINDAQKKVDKATSPEERKKALEELKQAYAGMNGEQLKAVKALQSFTSYFDKLRTEFEKPVLNIFIQGLNTLKTVLDLFKPTIDASVQAVQNLMNSLNRSLQTKDVEAFFGFLAMRAGPALENFGKMAGNVLRGVMNLMVLFSGQGKTMEQGLLRLTERFAEWTSNLGKTQGFKDFIQYAKENTPVLLGTLKNLWDILKNVTVALAPLGADLLKLIGSLTGIASKVTEVASAFSKWEGFEAVVYGIAGAIAAYTIVTKAQAAATKVAAGAQLLWNTLMTLNPIGLIVAALVGLGVAFVVAYKKSETFRNFVNKLWDTIKTGASAVLDFLKNNWPLLLSIITGPIGLAVYAVVKHWDSIKSATITAFNSVKKFLSDVWNGIKSIVTGVASVLVTNLRNNWNTAKTNATNIFNAIKNFFSAVWDGIKSIFNKVVTAIVNYVKGRWDNLKNNTTTVFNAVKSFLTNVWNGIKSVVSKVVSALVDFVKQRWNNLKNNTTTVFNAVKTFLTNVWNGIKSVVNKVVSALVDFVKQRWNNLKSNTTTVFNAIKTFLTNLWNGIKTTVTRLVDGIKNGIVKGWNAAKDQTKKIFNNIKSKVTSIFDDIVGAAKKLPGRIGDGIKSMASGVKKGVTSFANTLVKAMGKGLNGTITGINWVLEKVGASKIKKWEVPEYAKGTKGHPGGLAILGDGGEHELYRTPKGQVGLSPNTDTLMNLPKGTEVLNGKQTKQAMSAIPMYNKGTDKLADGAKAVGGWIKDKGTQAVEKGKEVAGAAKDLALDVWDYASDPAGLMKKVFAKFIPDLPKLKGAAVDMLKGGVKKAKDSSIDFIKTKLDEYMSFSDGGGGSYTGIGGYYLNNPFRITTRFTPGGNPNDRVHKGGVHKGLDLAAPQGTAIKSLTDGIVKQVLIGSSTAGNGVRIKSGSDVLSYIHMMAAPLVKLGQRVKEGQLIGRVGSTGFSTGPHLDLKIQRNGSYINPLTYLQGKAGGGGGATGGNYVGKYASIIRSAAARFGVSPALVAGIIKQESKFNPNARSPVGATGLMQLMPATSRSMGVKNPRDPQQNIMGGTKYISQMLRMFHNDTRLGLAAYNAGPGNVKKYGGIPPFRETQNYVRIVMANARGFGAQFKGYYKGARVAGKQLAWIAEKGAEYVIPTDGGQRAYDLWQQAGLENNFIGGATTNTGGSINITMPVTINGGATPQDAKMFVSTALPMIKKELIKDIKNDAYKRGMK